MSNYFNSSDFLNFTVGQPTHEENFEFRMMFSFSSLPIMTSPQDLDRYGTFVVTNEIQTWNSLHRKFQHDSHVIKYHRCTPDDIRSFGKSAE